jgi:pimeloyl-ACP methyl ester carboxylesterase
MSGGVFISEVGAGSLTTVNGVMLWNRTVDLTPPGVRDATPVVFVHGLNSSHDHCLQVRAVAGLHPVLTYDLRGHAQSEMLRAGLRDR